MAVESILVPETPEIISVERTLIPSSPTFIEPVRTLVDEKVEVKEEVDPWADFYVSGDSFDLFDGIYWFDLFINSSEVGVITVYIENGEAYLSYPELKDDYIYYAEPGTKKIKIGGPLNKIDLTGFNFLRVEPTSNIEICVTPNKDWENRSGYSSANEVDISTLTGEYYIQIGFANSGHGTVTKVWLE